MLAMWSLFACKAPVPPVEPVEAPSAEELLDRLGEGADTRTERSLRWTVRVQDLEGSLVETWTGGDYSSWMHLPGLSFGTGLVDGEGWEKRPTWGRIFGPRLEQLEATADPTRTWRDDVETAVVVGVEEPGWHLRVQMVWGIEEHWWIDPESFQMNRAEERHPQLEPHITVFEDYRDGTAHRILSGAHPLVFEVLLDEDDAPIEPPTFPVELALDEVVEFPLNDMQTVIQVGDRWANVHVDTGSSLTLLPTGPEGGLIELASTPGGRTAFRQVDIEASKPLPLGGIAILEGSPLSLLGQDVLTRGIAHFGEHMLRLHPFDAFETDLTAVPMHLNRDGQWLVDVGAGEVRFPALFDTGNPQTVINRRAAAELGIAVDDPRLVRSGSLAGLEGRPVPAYAITIPELWIGEVLVATDTEILVAELPGVNALAPGAAGVVGLAQMPRPFATDPRGSLYLPDPAPRRSAPPASDP